MGRIAPRLVAGLAGLALAMSQAIAQETTVRFGSVGGLTDAGLYLAEELGYFKEAGIKVEMQRIPNAPTLLSAIATEQLEVAGISVTPGLFTSVAQGMQLRIVGDKQSFRPGFSATRLVVQPALHVGREEEVARGLRGKAVAVSAKGSSAYMDSVKYLAKYQLAPADVRAVELAYPSMIPALTSGAVSAAVLLEPFLSQAIRTGVAKELSDLIEAAGATAKESALSVPMVYSEKFAQNRQAAQAFMIAYLRGVRVYNDAFVKGRDKDKVIEIMAKHAKLAPDVVRAAFPAGLDPNGRISIRNLAGRQDFFIQQKFIQAPIDVAKVVDLSFAEGAVAQLGEYAQ